MRNGGTITSPSRDVSVTRCAVITLAFLGISLNGAAAHAKLLDAAEEGSAPAVIAALA
jgi:hypothetical protein